jgi:hypothetical protein
MRGNVFVSQENIKGLKNMAQDTTTDNYENMNTKRMHIGKCTAENKQMENTKGHIWFYVKVIQPQTGQSG